MTENENDTRKQTWSDMIEEQIKSGGLAYFKPHGWSLGRYINDYREFMGSKYKQFILDFHECEKMFIHKMMLEAELIELRLLI